MERSNCGHKPVNLNCIHTLGMEWNCQVHQLGLHGIQCKAGSWFHDLLAETDKEKIVHFSSHPKPLDMLFGTVVHNETVHGLLEYSEAIETQDNADTMNGEGESCKFSETRIRRFNEVILNYQMSRNAGRTKPHGDAY